MAVVTIGVEVEAEAEAEVEETVRGKVKLKERTPNGLHPMMVKQKQKESVGYVVKKVNIIF